jgi:putative phosphotransacetylase
MEVLEDIAIFTLTRMEDFYGVNWLKSPQFPMSLPPPSPHRIEIEHLVRRSIYQRLGRNPPRTALAPNPLLVNISARHCHLTPEAVEALFGKGAKLTPMKWLYQKDQFAAKETVTLIGPRSRVISNLRILGPCREPQPGRARADRLRSPLGFDAPIRFSGSIAGTPAAC